MYGLVREFFLVDSRVLIRFGRPIMGFSFREALNIYYGLVTEHMNGEKRAAYDAKLFRPAAVDMLAMLDAFDDQIDDQFGGVV